MEIKFCHAKMRLNFVAFILVFGLGFFNVAWADYPGSSQAVYKLGIFPHVPPTRLQKIYSPIAEDFSKKLKKQVAYSTKKTFKKFMHELKKETYDFAFVQPFDYIWAHDNHNYLPLATRAEQLTTIFIVKKNSDIKSVNDIRGRKFINPPRVAAVSILTSVALSKLGLDPFDDVDRVFALSHFSCMQKVLIGIADVCGTAHGALIQFEKKKMAGRFRIIHQSDPIPHALYVVHKRVPAIDREIIKQTIIGWGHSAPGNKMLTKAKLPKFVEIDDAKYNIVRQIQQNANH